MAAATVRSRWSCGAKVQGRRLAAVLILVAATVHAQADTARVEDEAAGLFAQSCVPFAGDRSGLRQWIADHHLPALSPGGQAAFLHGQPGTAYDATSPAGKFVLIAGEDGSCSVISQRAGADALLAAFTRDMQTLGLVMQKTGEHADPAPPALRWIDYVASFGRRGWSLTVGTGDGPAMLSARPR